MVENCSMINWPLLEAAVISIVVITSITNWIIFSEQEINSLLGFGDSGLSFLDICFEKEHLPLREIN